VNVAVAADVLPAEMLLFYQLVTRPRRRLTLSYPAVDQRGQPLLPGSFLNAVADSFTAEAIPLLRRTMLIEGFDRDRPLSPAEWRVQVAREYAERGHWRIEHTTPMLANLADAAEVVRHRFHEREFTPYDGQFRDPTIVSAVHQLFRPERVFSPTALEDYAACPFRFFLRHVLRLEPLEEPREEIEVTRRGQAFHRALSRLHRDLRQQGIHQPAEPVDAAVLEKLQEAIREDIDRASGPAAKALWQIEGQRMLRVGGRYRQQWQDFVADWQKHELHPQPVHFEVDFGMPPNPNHPPAPGALVFPEPLVIRSGDIEVRISGRIDRVDLVELDGEVGFWIIDYKTGRASSYTSSALTAFHKLQLTLYALAVEEVLLKGTTARPLGLAYWLVADTGPKVVLPVERNKSIWLTETEKWRDIRQQLQELVAALAKNIRQGVFPLKPREDNCTETCDYGQMCRIAQGRAVDKAWSLL
jgi:ATP-dependent helicase/nuclease subunit B